MKKILVIGNSSSIFVKDFCQQFVKNKCIVDVLSIDNYCNIEGLRINKTINKNKPHGRLMGIISCQVGLFKIINELDSDYDCIVIHFIDIRLSFILSMLVKKTKRIVSVIWGSDFYRASSGFRKKLQGIIYRKSSAIAFTNPLTAEDFKKKWPNLKRIPLVIARFGLPVLDEIKNIRNKNIPRTALCDFFELPSNKVLILAGYNANLAQQQEFIIKQFSHVNIELREKAFIVFPLGYGNSLAENVIRKLLDTHEIKNFKILNKFYNFRDVAKLRSITDVLINIQPSDQFSGSMQETLFAGGRIIAGAWLPYAEISKNGASIIYVNTIDDVGTTIKQEILKGVSKENFGSKSICSYIDKSSSWQVNIKIWMDIMFKEEIQGSI